MLYTKAMGKYKKLFEDMGFELDKMFLGYTKELFGGHLTYCDVENLS